jgi:hypothetical protein
MAVMIHAGVFLVLPHSLVGGYQYVRGLYCLHFQVEVTEG